jgi:putative membrane protein
MSWLTSGIAFAQERQYDWGWSIHPMGWMGGMSGSGMMLMMLIFWALVIIAIVLGVRWILSQGGTSRSDTAMEILRQRYARGEIEKEEFEARRKDLTS